MSADEVTCTSCGVEFSMPTDLRNARRNDGGTFYCPNGHPLAYSDGPKDRRIKQLEAELADERRNTTVRFGELVQRKWELARIATTCPLCGEGTGRVNWRDETNRSKLVEHLSAEHGARRRLRAITERAGEGNA